jgi:hypothetical protein
MSETNDTWADRIHPVRCVCCDKNRSDSSLALGELQADGWINIDSDDDEWMCPVCDLCNQRSANKNKSMTTKQQPIASCVGCFMSREDVPEQELLADGWVRIGKGSYGWLCPACVRITDIVNGGPVLTSSCTKESGSSSASVAPAGLETPEMSPDYCTTREPPYYRIPDGATQLWHVIAALGMTHCQAMALKYVYRAGRKPGVAKVDDLRKAVANIEYEITRLEKDML